MIPEIVKRALLHTVTDIGQLTAEEVRTLNSHVKKGYLSKGKGGGFPAIKTVWAVPGYDFAGARADAIRSLLAACEAVGEKTPITFEDA